MSTTPKRFERQLTLLARRGYRAVTFTDAVTTPVGGRVVAITFDDAYRSVFDLARPILDRFAMPATVFAPTAGVTAGGLLSWPGIDPWIGGPHEHELQPMSWQQLRELAGEGWEIGSHTATHPHLTEVDGDALSYELQRSKADCESHMDRPCTSLAYPYGDVDERVVAAAANAGYVAAGALPHRLDSRGALEWPRIGVYRVDDGLRFRLKASPGVMRARSSPVWELFERSRGLLGA